MPLGWNGFPGSLINYRFTQYAYNIQGWVSAAQPDIRSSICGAVRRSVLPKIRGLGTTLDAHWVFPSSLAQSATKTSDP
jgi:hypothetical protein